MIKKRVGIIGYGSMGSMLLNGFANFTEIDRSDLYISTRTKEKLEDLKKRGFTTCYSNDTLVRECDIIFICLKPLDIRGLFEEIRECLDDKKHLISIAGSLTISNIEKMYLGKISRILPTFLSTINKGVTLACHNRFVSSEDISILEYMLNSISIVNTISENEFEPVSDLTSCAPGLFAAIFKEYVKAAKIHTGITEDHIRNLVISTLAGTAVLFEKVNHDFDYTIKHVATKGGATEAGLLVLESRLPQVFNEMFEKTLMRQRERMQKIDDQFD